MRPSSSWALLLLPLLSFGLSTHDEFISKAKANKGLLVLESSKDFERLIASDRTWSATIQLTALGSGFRCPPCKEFNPSFNTVAKAWSKAPAESRNQHFFATLDFDKGQDIFKRLGLNSAPVVFTYPAAKGSRRPASGRLDPLTYDFSNGFDADTLVEGINRHMPSPIPFTKPMNWAPIIGGAIFLLVAALAAPFILPLLQNKWVWAMFSIGTSLIMISGLMFVRIRGNPYVAMGRDGKAEWIASGFQNQFGMETHVVAFIYGMLSLSCLALIIFAPRLTSAWKQQTVIIVWSGIATVVFSVLLSFFRLKNPSYPYRLFL